MSFRGDYQSWGLFFSTFLLSRLLAEAAVRVSAEGVSEDVLLVVEENEVV